VAVARSRGPVCVAPRPAVVRSADDFALMVLIPDDRSKVAREPDDRGRGPPVRALSGSASARRGRGVNRPATFSPHRCTDARYPLGDRRNPVRQVTGCQRAALQNPASPSSMPTLPSSSGSCAKRSSGSRATFDRSSDVRSIDEKTSAELTTSGRGATHTGPRRRASQPAQAAAGAAAKSDRLLDDSSDARTPGHPRPGGRGHGVLHS
jgi:hypothetical protein